MARFYGVVQGSRGKATRCGTATSGLTTYAASWSGAVRATAYASNGADVDSVDVALVRWQGSGMDVPLYRGPVAPTIRELAAGMFPNGANARPDVLRAVAASLLARADELEQRRADIGGGGATSDRGGAA